VSTTRTSWRARGRNRTSSLWDAATTTLPFYRPRCTFVVTDPLRLGDGTRLLSGRSQPENGGCRRHQQGRHGRSGGHRCAAGPLRAANPTARIVEAASPVSADNANLITGRRVLVVEDGPNKPRTRGCASVPAPCWRRKRWAHPKLVDPRPFAVGSIARTFAAYPHNWSRAAGDGLRRRRRSVSSKPRSRRCPATWWSWARPSTSVAS